ncbi:MAG: VanZ family protein [Candidatus Aenigmarchaeota archaeon]|nr:VanZ family protein [Candidatus Aenigmarchaeota archaeon]
MGKLYLSITIMYMALIFYISSIPLEFPEVVDKLDPTKFSLHVVEYTILGILLPRVAGIKLSFLVGSLYGLSDEMHQLFVPFRVFSLWDWLADVIGIIFGILISTYLIKKPK